MDNRSCPLLLSNVYPYDRVPIPVDPNVTQLTPDIFSNVTNNLSAINTAAAGGSTITYLKTQLGDDDVISIAQLTDLQTKIAGGCTNPYLANPALLPVSFVVAPRGSCTNCATSSVTCTQVSALTASFATTYPSVTMDSEH